MCVGGGGGGVNGWVGVDLCVCVHTSVCVYKEENNIYFCCVLNLCCQEWKLVYMLHSIANSLLLHCKEHFGLINLF